MFWALILFLFGCLGLLIVLYVSKLVLAQMEVPPQIAQIVLLIIGLIGLLILLALIVHAFAGGFGPAPMGLPW